MRVTENAPKPRCHANGIAGLNVSLIHFDELVLVIRRTSEIASVGLSLAKM